MDKSSAAEKSIPAIEDNGKSLCAESYQSNEQPPHKRFGDKDGTDPKAQSERQKTFQRETAQVNGTLRIDDNIYDILGGSLYRRLPGNADKYSGEIKTDFEVNLNSGNKIDLKETEHTVLMQFTNLLEPARKHRLINNGKSGLVDVNAVLISSLTNLPASNRAIKEYVSN
ncbi:MAG: hypothetical protein K2X77_28195 [Candidatus Obscuribacterales bacterium]|jgi:hypothetical protein|nr:hypothetical protein [Candidatus Obscuribacterales bacterium]